MVRLVHIEKSQEHPNVDPTYAVIDASRYGDESGPADILQGMTREKLGDWLAREGLAYSAIERVFAETQQSGSASVELPLRFGPRIVRAWFDTVINPLVRSLESELALLRRQNWTFSFRTGKCDLIRQLRAYLESEAWANLDQILEIDPPLEANTTHHDQSVEILRDAVAALHRRLAANPEFRSLCDSLLTTEKLQELDVKNPTDIFGAYSESDRYDLLAQYVVNNTGELSSHYTTAKFWNRNREMLLQSMNVPGINNHSESALQAGDQLSRVASALLGQLRNFRDELSLRYDVPLVTSTVR